MSDIEEEIEILDEEEEEIEEVAEEEEEEDDAKDDSAQFVSQQSKANLFKKEVVIAPEKRRTSEVLTLFEMTEITSIRGQQISQNPLTLLKDIGDLSDPVDIAKREIDQGVCPLVLRRVIGTMASSDGVITEYVEYWDVNKMAKSVVYGV